MKASEEIRSILDRCKSRELAHNQASYFCRTSKCLAGWKVALDFAARFGREGTIPELRKYADPNHRTPVWSGPWNYAQKAWKLSEFHALGLFHGEATFTDQYAVVAELEAEGK